MSQNVQTTSQLHSSHTLAKQCSKFSKPGFNSMWTKNFQMFKLDLEKQRNQRSNFQHPLDHRKKQESSRKTSTFVLLTMSKPLTVWITTNCGKFLEVGIPDQLTSLLRNLYTGQEATVRTGHGTMDWFKIGKGVLQGCMLSSCLFNLYAEWNARLDESQAGIKIARRDINNFR